MGSIGADITDNWTRLQVSASDGVVEVALARPEARNALDPTMMVELTELARRLRRHPASRAVILRGEATFFSAGVDLGAARGRNGSANTLLDLRCQVAAGPDLCRAWEEIEAPTVVAIEGFCIGGAAALAVACDFRIMGHGAHMRLPEIPLGMNMSWQTLPRLAALVGPSRAKRMALFGDKLDTETCLAWGLCDEAAPSGGALEAARRWAARLAALPPLPVRMTKEAVNAAALANAQAVSVMDRDQYLLAARSKDLSEGVAAFFEKRPPKFTGD